MKLLITGGSGFMGSHFIAHILKKYPDYTVVNYDRQESAFLNETLDPSGELTRYRFIRGDVTDFDSLEHAARGVDTIINYAGATHVDHSIINADDFIKTNILGLNYILRVIKEQAIGRFIQISTDEVYGSRVEGRFDELDPYMPNSPYSASKAGGDLLIRAFCQTHHINAIITHSNNVFGPNQSIQKAIPLFITNLLSGKPITLYGDGSNIRCWLYVSDHCRAIDLLLHQGEAGEMYNIGTANELTNLELAKKLVKAMAADESLIQFVDDRPGHDFRYALAYDKIQKLGWSPRVGFDDGLKRTIQWYTR